ncbi:2-amino-4-hydroxy-6-hydroxymethyldihydropteridinediphosphokinase [Fontimonas thermophila]|uniref:2-amino-4-hydroxy-6-hydroxymethyldihydropteridine pyrophosphokinase n=1 Tax=Fontimonas thermophila TaxID=1076937 RepID=A0A1I2HL71_9GAMM|nr:2-amino-4-hydroxy-6-hydroxymethyldihydropteridine diphosphokinase [Fontimonas thermophila]SFF30509.1 2-amino-4-hydroxy-6-hydroxymethyldihydropteridinediphosphokinase [Fontimonas thermophila]
MRRAYIGLGANLGDPPAQLRAALAAISQLGRLVAVSPFYRSAPMGPAGQPDYCNAACALDTALDAAALMAALLSIERRMGRVRSEKWGPRTIDLDLLHVEGEVRADADLTLPHPGIGVRNFVLVPLADIAPELWIPGIGGVADAAARIGRQGLAPWPPAP